MLSAPPTPQSAGRAGLPHPAVYASRAMLPAPMQDLLPADWLVPGRELNPLDPSERTTNVMSSHPVGRRPSGPCADIANPSKMTHCSPSRCQFLPRSCPRHDQSPPGVPRRSKLRLGSQARASRCEFARHRQSDRLSKFSIQAVQPDAAR